MSIKIIVGSRPDVQLKTFRIAVDEHRFENEDWRIRRSYNIPEQAEVAASTSLGTVMVDLEYRWFEVTLG
jgi:hypothetical protein